MRRTLLSLFLSIFTLTAGAQIYPHSDKQVFFYTNTGLALGGPSGARFSLDALVASHHILSLGCNYFSKKARATPHDYLAGQGWDLGLAASYPQDSWFGLTLSYGYVLYPRRSSRIRWVLGTGLLIGTLTTPDQFTPTHGGFNLFGTSNPPPTPGYYAYASSSHEGVAFLLHPRLDYSASRAFGLSIGAYGIFSDGMNGGGITGSILLGKVSNNRKLMPQRIYHIRQRRAMRRAKRWAMVD